MTSAHRFLLVEDDYLVAVLIEQFLGDLGHEVASVAGTLREALEQAREGSFDAALVDLMLRGALSFPVADILMDRGIPFAFVTGRAREEVPPAYAAVPVLGKPFHLRDFAAIIARLSSARG